MDFKCRTGRFSRSLVLPSSVVLSRGISGEITQTEEILLTAGKKTRLSVKRKTGYVKRIFLLSFIDKMQRKFQNFQK